MTTGNEFYTKAKDLRKVEVMVISPKEAEARWRAWQARMAKSLCHCHTVRESAVLDGGMVDVDERLVQAIWADGMVDASRLATASGKAVEVLNPGRWNTAGGPDFLDAELRIAGRDVRGDVEIHINSASWRQHGHHQDFEYNRVVLHVVLKPHDDRAYDEKQNGERMERLVLGHFLEPDLETIRQTINPSEYPHGRPADLGICHEEFLKLSGSDLQEFLLAAGRARMEDKIARFEAQSASSSPLQVLYQAAMTSQGFKSSKTLYFLLSKRAPISELQEFSRDLPSKSVSDVYYSVLSHVANIYPTDQDVFGSDEETTATMGELGDIWKQLRPYFSDRLIPPTRRWFSGMRPAGFPTRRLAAMSLLMDRLTRKENNAINTIRRQLTETSVDLLAPKKRSAFWKSLVEPLIVEEPDHYFASHFTFGGKKGRPQALLGEPAARSLMFNVVLPILILSARKEKDELLERRAWEAVFQFPSLEKNSVVRFMGNRLFGDGSGIPGLLKMEINQQALLKVFTDCCANNERSCGDCTLLTAGNFVGVG